jgi:hypothetical protein
MLRDPNIASGRETLMRLETRWNCLHELILDELRGHFPQHPQDLKITWIYELPFGKSGKWLKEGALSYIAGGWTMSAIQTV